MSLAPSPVVITGGSGTMPVALGIGTTRAVVLDGVLEVVGTCSVTLETIDAISGTTELVIVGTSPFTLETTGTVSGTTRVVGTIDAVGTRDMVERALIGAGIARIEAPKTRREMIKICILECGRIKVCNDEVERDSFV